MGFQLGGHEGKPLCPIYTFCGRKDAMSKVAINTPSPDFELADYTGKPVRLSDLRGQNVLLVFNRGFV
jgi:cytochrome oxidase Cu insertion factor (SCO1/SenC/PrrC family)